MIRTKEELHLNSQFILQISDSNTNKLIIAALTECLTSVRGRPWIYIAG